MNRQKLVYYKLCEKNTLCWFSLVDLERSLKRREDEIDNLRRDKDDLNKIRESQKSRIEVREYLRIKHCHENFNIFDPLICEQID